MVNIMEFTVVTAVRVSSKEVLGKGFNTIVLVRFILYSTRIMNILTSKWSEKLLSCYNV